MWLLYTIIACFLWSFADVMSGVLVRHFHHRPVIITWLQSVVVLIMLSIFVAVFSVRIDSFWLMILALSGLVSYCGHLWYFTVLKNIDVSVMNASWSFLAILVSIVGMFLFGERWTLLQSFGCVIVLCGVLILAFWHQHVSLLRTIGMMLLLGSLFVPMAIAQKAALEGGGAITSVFFWPAFGMWVSAFLYPIIKRTQRSHIAALQTGAISFICFFLIFATAVAGIFGQLLITYAYSIGYVSFITVSENSLPFITLFLAWLAAKLFPRSAPRELLTAQSVWLKCVSFGIVFTGLALLAV